MPSPALTHGCQVVPDPAVGVRADSYHQTVLGPVYVASSTHPWNPRPPKKMFSGLTVVRVLRAAAPPATQVPDDGNIFILFGPHIAISETGELGKYKRIGQKYAPSINRGGLPSSLLASSLAG